VPAPHSSREYHWRGRHGGYGERIKRVIRPCPNSSGKLHQNQRISRCACYIIPRNWRRGEDSNLRYPCRHNGFRDRRVRPLCHLSAHECYAPVSAIAGVFYSRVGAIVQPWREAGLSFGICWIMCVARGGISPWWGLARLRQGAF
jgi:hypothetical protein